MSLLFKVRTRSERIDSMWGVLEDTVSLLRSHKVVPSWACVFCEAQTRIHRASWLRPNGWVPCWHLHIT